MSMPGAPPRISSMRSTWDARVRDRTEEPVSFFDAGRAPLIRMLPTAPSKPRLPSPSLLLKPGTRLTMSRAVFGRWSAKKSGVKTRTPRWPGASVGAGAGDVWAWAAPAMAKVSAAAPAAANVRFILSPLVRIRRRPSGRGVPLHL